MVRWRSSLPFDLRPVGILLLVAVLCAATVGPVHAADPEYQNLMRAATSYLNRGQYELAARLLTQVLSKHPNDLRASIAYIRAQIGLEDFVVAEEFLAQALEANPDTMELLQVRARLLEEAGKPEEAFEDVLLVAMGKAETASWSYRETVDLYENGLPPAYARRRIAESRQEHPDLASLVVLDAVVTVLDGNGETALRVLTEADAGNTRGGGAILIFAREMQAMGREDVALEAYLAAVDRMERPADRATVLFDVAAIQERNGKYEDVLASLDRIIAEREGTSSSGRARLWSAEIHQNYLNDPEGALLVYEQIQDDPVLGHHRPDMLLQMADCYALLGRFEEAAATYEEVEPEAFDPEQAELAAKRKGDVALYAGDVEKAMELYQDMAERYPRSLYADDAAARYILLNRQKMMGSVHSLVLYGQMEWALLAGDSSGVEVAAGELIADYGTTEIAAEAWLALAGISEEAGDYARAVARLQSLVAAFPSSRRAPQALMEEGRLLESRLGRPQEALMRYESILTDYPQSVYAGDARRRVESLRRELKS